MYHLYMHKMRTFSLESQYILTKSKYFKTCKTLKTYPQDTQQCHQPNQILDNQSSLAQYRLHRLQELENLKKYSNQYMFVLELIYRLELLNSPKQKVNKSHPAILSEALFFVPLSDYSYDIYTMQQNMDGQFQVFLEHVVDHSCVI